MDRAVVDARAQDRDHAALGNLALQAVEEFTAGGAVGGDVQGGQGIGLGGFEELQELGEVEGVFAEVVLWIARDVTGLGDQGLDDKSFEGFFAGVCGHVAASAVVVLLRKPPVG